MKVVCALSNLFKGNKIRSTGWDEGDYQHQQKNGDTIFYSAVDDESIVIDSDNLNRNLYNTEGELNLNPIKASCDIEYKLISYYRAYRKELKDNKDYDKWEVIDYCKQIKQTPIEVGSRVRFIEDVPHHNLKKGYSADINTIGLDFYHINDNSCYYQFVNKSSVVHENDYIEG